MKVLYIATSFPSPEKGDTIYTDLAEKLVERGHSVTVIASGERKYTSKTIWSKERNCDVLRVKTGNIYDVKFIEKAISILSLEYLIKLAIKKNLYSKKFDLILYESPPVTNCGIIKYAKRKFKAKTYLMLKDIFPQNAVDIGIMKKGSIPYKIFKRKEKQLYDISDKIGCMSKRNKEYILKHNKFLSEDKVEIFPNTKKIKSNIEFIKDYSVNEKYGIPKDAILVIYGGNMGKPQGVHILCEAINRLKSNNNIFFILVGRGTEKKNIKDFLEVNKCKNTLVLDNLPREEYEKLVIQSDIGVVMLDSRFTIPNYPSRILAYMEYSIPVIAATDSNTDFKELIEEAKLGLWCCSMDVDTLCNNINKLVMDKELRVSMGENGRKFIEENFEVSKSVDILENLI